ncbi:MAG TPA: response regulator [Bacillota bacterium]|nr:response regulator [Bacillota bacterium]
MKKEILQKINVTKETIKTTMDSFIMDQKTQSYNELFLKEYLSNYLTLTEAEDKKINLYLMVLHIDNLPAINVKYTSQKGDETIQNLGYLLRQVQSDDDLLFKGKGPGYILLVHDYPGNNIKDYAIIFQNKVKNSDIFIEQITISVAVVGINEIDSTLPTEEKVEQLLAKATERINLSHEMPNNAYIEKDFVTSKSFLGHILIVDDDQLSSNISKSFFERKGYKVTVTKDGVSALSIAENNQFDVIIVDVFALKMDGVTLKQHLNESTINMNTIYILVVQNKTISLIEKANMVSIDYVISKPIIYEEIFGFIVREFKKRSKSSL